MIVTFAKLYELNTEWQSSDEILVFTDDVNTFMTIGECLIKFADREVKWFGEAVVRLYGTFNEEK